MRRIMSFYLYEVSKVESRFKMKNCFHDYLEFVWGMICFDYGAFAATQF